MSVISARLMHKSKSIKDAALTSLTHLTQFFIQKILILPFELCGFCFPSVKHEQSISISSDDVYYKHKGNLISFTNILLSKYKLIQFLQIYE